MRKNIHVQLNALKKLVKTKCVKIYMYNQVYYNFTIGSWLYFYMYNWPISLRSSNVNMLLIIHLVLYIAWPSLQMVVCFFVFTCTQLRCVHVKTHSRSFAAWMRSFSKNVFIHVAPRREQTHFSKKLANKQTNTYSRPKHTFTFK